MKKIIEDLQKKEKTDLQKQAEQLNQEIASMIIEAKVNPGKDTNIIGKKRKELAQIKTIISLKK